MGFKKCQNSNAFTATRVCVNLIILSQNESSFRFLVDKWLSPTQGDQRLFVELSREKPRTPRKSFCWIINEYIK